MNDPELDPNVFQCEHCGALRIGSTSRDDCAPASEGIPSSGERIKPPERTHVRQDAEPASANRTPVCEIMSRNVLSVKEGMNIDVVTALLVERGFGGAPVVDDEGRPIGMISKTDLVRRNHEGPSGEDTVGQIMMPVAFSVPANESIARAAALMAFEGVHRVPIVGARGQLVGLVSPLDVLRWLAREHGYLSVGTTRSDVRESA